MTEQQLRPRMLVYTSEEHSQFVNELAGKFLQFIWNDQIWLVFASSELHRYHTQILEHFLKDRGIPHSWIDDQTLKVGDPAVEITGGGRFRVKEAETILELWDNSQAYGRFNETSVTDEIASSDHPWSKFYIRIT
jgi:hypothetical protein